MHTDARGTSRKLSLNHLSDDECEKILQVLQKDFELREQEKGRLDQIKQVIQEEEDKEEVIAKKTKLNENVCVRCCQTFGIIFNRRQLCQTCKLFACKSCCEYDKENKGYTCKGCIKEKELKLKSLDWFYNNVSKKFKRFGSAKVVRTLYKQKTSRSRPYHTDNESDSGYDPSLYLSLRDAAAAHPAMRGMYHSEGEQDYDVPSIGPVPITPTTISRASSIETLAQDKRNYNQTNNVKSGNVEEQEVQTEEKQEKDKQDIYQEAFERYKDTEEKKFRGKFENLLKDLQQSLEKPVITGGTSFGSTSYGEVIENYRGRLRELLIGVSQRLEMAVESFDTSPNQTATDTLQKVRKLVSKLVEDSFGEPIDVTSDEAVSDLSSLSDDSCDHQVKSFEDQISQAVVARVLENFRRDSNIDIPLDFLDGNISDSHVSDKSHGSHVTPDNKSHDLVSRGASSDDENSVVTRIEQVPSRLSDSGINNIDDGDSQQNSDLEGSFEVIYLENLNTKKQFPHKQRKSPRRRKSDRSKTESSDEDDTDVGVHDKFEEIKNEKESVVPLNESENCVEETECDNEDETDDSNSVQRDLAELKRFAKEIASPRHCVQRLEVHEFVEQDEEPIEKVTVDRQESQYDCMNKLSFYDRVHDSHVPLPDLSEDYEDNDFFLNEVDPDLLSMNLAPILEEDEDNYIEEEDDEENDQEGATARGHWRDNWMFGSSQLSPYSNVGRQVGARTMDQVYLTIPTPEDDFAAKVGNRDVDQMSDDLSEKDDIENLSDEESSFFAKSMEEISRITSRKSPSPAPSNSIPTTASVQTDSEMDTSFDTTTSLKSVASKKSETNYIEDSVPSAEGDPKFEVPPDSLTVLEGEPAKFTCRVSGSEPLDVIWYKVEEGEPVQLEDSVDCEHSKELNRHSVTIFNQTKSGQYMCMAVNDKDHCLQYIILTVKKNPQEMKRPEFLKEIQDLEVKEGQNVKFRSKVKGYPQPRVVWCKDGHVLSNGGNYRIEKYGNRDYILTIDYATLDDDAEYWVVAKNVAGEAKSTAQLIVESTILDSSNKTKEPTKTAKNKDEQQLVNMSKKLFMTREHLQEETEDMINSANKLSEMHKSLDEFDDMLSSFEKEINTTNPPSDDWDSDMLLSHNLQNAVDNFNDMKNAAEGVRNTTSSALQILKSTQSLLDSEQQELDRDYLAASTPRNEESPVLFTRQDSTNNNLSDRTSVEKVDNSPEVTLSKGENSPVDNSSYLSAVDNIPNVSSSPVNESLVPRLSLSPSSKSEDNIISDVSVNSNVSGVQQEPPHQNSTHNTSLDNASINQQLDDSEPTVINFGPKEIEASQYNRDFYVGDKNKPATRKWEVKTTSYSPRAEVVNQQKLQHTEDEVSHIEKSISELHNCPTITTTAPPNWEDNSSSLSPSLSIDSGFSSIREKPPQTHLFGETMEDDLPESRTELNEETGVELPSVNRLKALFNTVKTEDASVKRVHSITARSVPKEKLEKLRQRSPSITKPVQIDASQQGTPSSPQNVSVTLLSGQPSVEQIERNPKQIFPKKEGEFFPPRTPPVEVKQDLPIKTTATVTIATPVSSKSSTPVSNNKSQTKQRAPAPPNQESITPKSSESSSQASGGSKSNVKGKSRIRAGCISARASFWEKRIHGEETKEEEYPDMIEQVSD